MRYYAAMISLAVLVAVLFWGNAVQLEHLKASGDLGALKRADGLQLSVSRANADPILRIALPGHTESECAIEVIFPEHVTARKHGAIDAEHMYLFRSGPQGARPLWRRLRNSIEYERELPNTIHMLARATLENDVVLYHYEFTNRSDLGYDMIYAVTVALTQKSTS